jgi:hypothetical protein
MGEVPAGLPVFMPPPLEQPSGPRAVPSYAASPAPTTVAPSQDQPESAAVPEPPARAESNTPGGRRAETRDPLADAETRARDILADAEQRAQRIGAEAERLASLRLGEAESEAARTRLQADAAAARAVGDADQHVQALKRQVDSLIQVRDELGHTREAAAPRAATVPLGPTEAPVTAPPHEPEGAQQSAEHEGFGLYAGQVSLTIGPFEQIAQLEDAERRLATITGLGDLYLRVYERGRAVYELTLTGSVPLFRELRRVLSGSFQVTDAAESSLAVHLGDQSHPSAADLRSAMYRGLGQ